VSRRKSHGRASSLRFIRDCLVVDRWERAGFSVGYPVPITPWLAKIITRDRNNRHRAWLEVDRVKNLADYRKRRGPGRPRSCAERKANRSSF
jgi:hypothetical protein